MDVKQAVDIAKLYVADLFVDEKLKNFGLEEVDFDDHKKVWFVTIGFSRPWDETQSSAGFLTGQTELRRAFKTVRVSDTSGKVLSVKNREAP